MALSSAGTRIRPTARRFGPRLWGLVLLWALVLALAQPAFTQEKYARVKAVFDGDSVVLASGSGVRYLGIDCPELARDRVPDMDLAREAAAFNRSLVLGKLVSLEFDREKKDRYERLLAYVYLKDGRFVNGLLVEEGLAWVYTKRPNLKMRPRLIELQRKAITAKKGLWALPAKATEPFYRAGKNSFIFHRPSCTAARGARGRIFKNRMEAFWQGYSPCRSCNP